LALLIAAPKRPVIERRSELPIMASMTDANELGMERFPVPIP